jgi:hypothetical protein
VETKWIEVIGNTNVPIGAVAVHGNSVPIVVAYFDDLDGNRDGRVSMGEKVAGFLAKGVGLGGALSGSGVLAVVMAARHEPDIVVDTDFISGVFSQTYSEWSRRTILDAAYGVYFKPLMGLAAGQIAGNLTGNAIKAFAIKKGMEAVAAAIIKPVLNAAA